MSSVEEANYELKVALCREVFPIARECFEPLINLNVDILPSFKLSRYDVFLALVFTRLSLSLSLSERFFFILLFIIEVKIQILLRSLNERRSWKISRGAR